MNIYITITRWEEVEYQGLRGSAEIKVCSRDKHAYKIYCESLENKTKKIPEGVYKLTITYSPKFKRKLILVNNVYKRSGIRIHPFNWGKESEGCITLGSWVGDGMINQTTLTCNHIQRLINESEKATLKIIDHVQSTDNNSKS